MRTFLLTLAVLLFAVVVVVACAGLPTSEPTTAERPPSAPGGLAFVSPIETPVPGVTATPGQVLPPVVIDLALSTPVMVNQPVTLTISVRANMEIDEGSAFGFGLKTASAGFLENYTMTLPSLAQNEVMQMTQILQIPGREGRYSITAALSPRNIGNTIYAQAIYFAVNGTSIVFSPTPGPAMTTTVEVIGRPTSAPTQTPEAPVTPVPEVTATSEPGAASPVLPVTSTTETAAETSIKRAQTETVTIKGRLRIPVRPHLLGASDPMPSRFTKVSVYNLNDLSTPPGDTTHGNPPDQLLGETVTYPDGSWYLHDVPLTDVDGTRPDVYVIYHATNASSFGQMRSVRNMNSEVYKFPLKSAATTWWDYPSPGDPGAPPLIDDLLGTGTTDLPALWLLDDANRAYRFVQGYAFKDPGQVHLHWALGDDWSGLCGSVSCFGPITGSPNGFGAFIQDAIRDMPDVAVHEIAHAYRHSLTGSWVSSCPGMHYAWWVTNPQCAWEEGWADFLPTVVNGDPCYDDNTNYGPCDPLIPDANLENPTWGDNKSTGGSVEGRVAGALLDIHDAADFPPEADDEGWDNTNWILSLTWKVLDPATEGNSESTITDFWRHWNGYHGPATYSITGPLYQSTITTHVFIPMFQ